MLEVIQAAPWGIFAPWTQTGDINGIAWALYLVTVVMVVAAVVERVK